MHTYTLGHLRRHEPSCTFPAGRPTTAGGRPTTQQDSLGTRQPSENQCWQKSKASSPVCFRRITTTTSLDSACTLATLWDTSGGRNGGNQAAHSPLVVKQPPVVATQPSQTLFARGSPQKIHAGRNQRQLHQYAFGGLRQRHPWTQHAHLQHSWTPPAASTKLHIPRWSSNNRRWSPHNPARLSWHTAALRKSMLAEIKGIFTSMLSEDYDNDIPGLSMHICNTLGHLRRQERQAPSCTFPAGRQTTAGGRHTTQQDSRGTRQPSENPCWQKSTASSPVCFRRITTTTSWTQHAHLQHSWTPPAAGTAGTKLHIPRWSSNNRRWSPDNPARLSWRKPSENPCWQKSRHLHQYALGGLRQRHPWSQHAHLQHSWTPPAASTKLHIPRWSSNNRRRSPHNPARLSWHKPSENPCWQKSKASSPVCFRRITTTTSLDSACTFATLLDTSAGINQAAHSPLVGKQPPVVATQPSKTLLARGSPQKIHAGRNQRHLHQYAFGGLRQRHPWTQHAHLQHSWTPPAASTKLHIPRWSSNNRRWSPHNQARLSWHAAALRKSMLAEIKGIFTSMLSEDYDNDIPGLSMHTCKTLGHLRRQERQEPSCTFPAGRQTTAGGRRTTQPESLCTRQPSENPCWQKSKASSPVCFRRITTTTSLDSACTFATLWDTSGGRNGRNQAAHSPLVGKQPPVVATQHSKILVAHGSPQKIRAGRNQLHLHQYAFGGLRQRHPGLSMLICNTPGHLRRQERQEPSCTFPAGRQTTAGGRQTAQQDSLGTSPQKIHAGRNQRHLHQYFRRITPTTSLDSACTFATLLDTSGGMNQAAHSPLVVQQPPVVAP